MHVTSEEITSAAICDALEMLGLTGQDMGAEIKPVDPQMRLSGPAFPVSCGQGDSWAWAIVNVLDQIPVGWVLVVKVVSNREWAVAGDLTAAELKNRGGAGLVIDGAVRDPAGLRRLGFPTFARTIVPGARHGRPDAVAGTGSPVRCGGVAVAPGDLVFGDEMGVVAVPKDRVEKVLGMAAERIRREDQVRQFLAEGKSLLEVGNALKYACLCTRGHVVWHWVPQQPLCDLYATGDVRNERPGSDRW